MQFCTTSMSAIKKLTRHGAITHTHTPCLLIANMADIEGYEIVLALLGCGIVA